MKNVRRSLDASLMSRLKARLRLMLPANARSHHILAGPLRGHPIVTSWRDYPAAITGRTERLLLEWFGRHVKAGETWLDVGAHYGYTAIALSRLVGLRGRVFAFEPMLATVGCLSLTRALNRFEQLTIVPFALGSTPGIRSLRAATTRGMVDHTIASDQMTDTFVVSALDWLWPQLCGEVSRIDGIKLDVQGHEIETVLGMTSLLASQQPKLVIEFHRGVDREAVLQLLERAGYCRRATAIEPTAGEAEACLLDDRSYAFTVTRCGV